MFAKAKINHCETERKFLTNKGTKKTNGCKNLLTCLKEKLYTYICPPLKIAGQPFKSSGRL